MRRSCLFHAAFSLVWLSIGPLHGAESRDVEPKRVRTWIENLRSSLPEIRESAARSLLGAGADAAPLLAEAARGSHADAAKRAQAILEEILESSLQLLDGALEPIEGADVTVHAGETSLSFRSGPLGLIPLPEEPGGLRLQVLKARMRHPDYGEAIVDYRREGSRRYLYAPLVRAGTSELERALRGTVVGADGRPLPRARIRCTEVRTPGEGLIPGHGPYEVIAGPDGTFAVYLPDRDPDDERGDRIPLGSRFSIVVEPPEGADLFPHVGRYPNTEPARVVLESPRRFVSIAFEDPAGGTVTDIDRLRQVSMTYRREDRGQALYLGSRFAEVGGGKLLAGRYTARLGDSEYLPVEVRDDGPDHVTFRLPPEVTFVGRVVDGVTGEPLAGAFVFGYSSISHNNLALLTAKDYETLEALPDSAAPSHPAAAPLEGRYTVECITRTGPDGGYSLTRPRGREVYALIAFARDALPYSQRTHRLEPDASLHASVPDLPLFPAATVVVRPVFEEGRISVSPKWVIPKEDQPGWVDRFLGAQDDRQLRECEYVHWLALNEVQPLHVPAGLRVRLELRTPYDEEWVPEDVPGPLLLERGETKDLGELRFHPAVEVSVRVVDRQGAPVEGVPVRYRAEGEDTWSVAHNTDRDGIARFHAPPQSSSSFRVSDFPPDAPESKAPNLRVSGEVGDAPPSEPFTIRLSDRQIELVLRRSPSVDG